LLIRTWRPRVGKANGILLVMNFTVHGLRFSLFQVAGVVAPRPVVIGLVLSIRGLRHEGLGCPWRTTRTISG